MKNINWMLVAIVLVSGAIICWCGGYGCENESVKHEAKMSVPHRFHWPFEEKIARLLIKPHKSESNEIKPYQLSTNLAALPLEKRLFVTNNFIPLANQFLRQFPTQHHPIEAKDIKAVSVNYGVKGSVWSLSKIEADDGTFQLFAITVDGTNHIQSYRDLTDYDISVPGTVSDLKITVTGTTPSVITGAAQAKAFTHALLEKFHFDFQNYLDPPVAVPYTALPNYGLWQVHYISKQSDRGQSYIDFVIDGTGKNGPFFRWVCQTPDTWSLPSTPQK
jgi:hypothetical protein